MRIDNDFLTLLDLTLRLHHLDRIEDELAGYDIEGVMPLMVKIGELCGKRKDLVAKINAADDADAAVAKQTADLTDATQKTNDALAKVLKTIAALNEKPIIHEGRTIEIAGQAKDAAPAPAQPKGFTTSGATLDEAINKLIKAGCPIHFEKVRDQFAGNGAGGEQYFARWNVSPKDADGEGR
jgi:hypothetical protein